MQRPNTVYLCADTIDSSTMVNFLRKCRSDVHGVWKNYMFAYNHKYPPGTPLKYIDHLKFYTEGSKFDFVGWAVAH